MRATLGAVLLGLALLALAAPEARAERIRDFSVELHLEKAGAFRVEERITYDFGSEQRHGIFRDVPVRYGRGAAADYRIDLDVLSVTDEGGNARPYRAFGRGPYRRIRIGDPQRTQSGVQEYRIAYRVRRGVLWFEDHDELYWNATGAEWPVPIDAARIEVVAPEGPEAGEARSLCFTGARGSVETACRTASTGRVTSAEALRPLGPGEGLTLVLALPKGLLREPSAARRALDRATDYVSWASALPFLVFALMGTWWWRAGRDPSGPVAIPVRYDPPEGMTPAEMGTVLDEKADLADVTATILDLAVRGYLRIEETETKRLFFLSVTGYRLHRLRSDETGLKRHEVKLLSALFSEESSVDVADLSHEFYKHLPGIQSALYEQVSKEGGWFPTSPDRVRGRYRIAVAVLSIAGFLLAFALGDLPLILSVVASSVVGLFWARVMPRRTKQGRRARQHIEGFREFVERVEADRLERLGLRTIERFEKLLPFAFVLGAADTWAEGFADLYTTPPTWYASAQGGPFRPRHFVGQVGHSLQTLGTAMTSKPRGSGSSGFSSGGGFSGGGFGGGGGGSW